MKGMPVPTLPITNIISQCLLRDDLVLLFNALSLRLAAVGVKLFAIDSEGLRACLSSLKGAALVQEARLRMGGFSKLSRTSW